MWCKFMPNRPASASQREYVNWAPRSDMISGGGIEKGHPLLKEAVSARIVSGGRERDGLQPVRGRVNPC